MALSIFETAFGKDRTVSAPRIERGRRRFDYQKGQYVESGAAGREKFADVAGRTLTAVQMVCDALIPPSAGRYTVAFGGRTAMTERGKRRITITPQPLYMKGLRLADVADTLTGFVVHEIGHVEISGATDEQVSAWLASEPGYLPWRDSIHAISNVLDDHALEVWAKRRFPGVGHTFRVTTKFVAQEQGLVSKPPRQFKPTDTYTDRFNFMVVAVRYRWFARWIGDPATQRERQWWIDWAEQYGNPDDATVRLAGIKAGIARLAIKPENRPPEDEQPEPQPGEGEGEDAESDEEPETFDTGEDEDDEGDDEGDGEGDDDDLDDEDDDDADGDGEDGDESDDEGEDDDDAPTGGGNDDDDPTDEDEDESEHQPLGSSESGTADPEDDDEDDDDFESDDFDGSEDDADGDESDGTDESAEAGLSAGESGNDTTDEYDEDDGEDRPEGGHLDTNPDSLGQEGEGSSNAPIYEGFEPERLAHDRVQTVDDFNDEREQYDRHRDERLQEQVEVEMRAERVTDTHGYGEMKVVINL